MSSDMKDSTQLTALSDHRQHHHRHHYHHQHQQDKTLVNEDECSIDSGCSSDDSTGSCERPSRRSSSECLCRSSRSSRRYSYLEQLRGRSTRSQERFSSSVQRSLERTWSPAEDVRNLSRGSVSPSSYSSSPSDAYSSDSDSFKRFSTTETLRRAFQSLKIASAKSENNKEKKHAKKSPKKILRSPVLYMYVRGPSGLPTQRVPRSSGLQQQTIHLPYSCQDLIGLYQ
ncbi:hypothetical protein DMN91_003667 [Ooceraea biroi]|uniref:DUF4797 domain-containing protein n=2 Tax=Ooceraea biroi TaxID=2015173 RepID=A0A3L8DTH8_OOCBI|nr:uncharacterized protein LOC105285826 [Ooceraea biroi]RLU23463.1 hypothetical protein DMN91_003667 [Ooceraea biroi]